MQIFNENYRKIKEIIDSCGKKKSLYYYIIVYRLKGFGNANKICDFFENFGWEKIFYWGRNSGLHFKKMFEFGDAEDPNSKQVEKMSSIILNKILEALLNIYEKTGKNEEKEVSIKEKIKYAIVEDKILSIREDYFKEFSDIYEKLKVKLIK